MATSKASDVYDLARACLHDNGAQWATNAYLKPYLKLANLDVNQELDSLNLTYEEKVVVISAVPAQTTTLSAYMADGQALEDLEEPTTLEWRRVGETDLQWKPVGRKDKVLDTDGTLEGISSWEWRGGIPYLTKSSIDVDLRIRYDSLTISLDDPTSEIVRGLLNVLAYRTSFHVACWRGGLAGTGKPLTEELDEQYKRSLDNFESTMVKRSQFMQRRFGKSSRRNGGSYMTPYVSHV